MSDEVKPDEPPVEVVQRKGECLGQYKHKYEWVWKGPEWTDRMKCMNCGHVKADVKRFEGQ